MEDWFFAGLKNHSYDRYQSLLSYIDVYLPFCVQIYALFMKYTSLWSTNLCTKQIFNNTSCKYILKY